MDSPNDSCCGPLSYWVPQGLELSEKYFWQHGAPLIEKKFADYQTRIAAGLAGEGSECFGFDDEISKDHDWGPGFCLWLTKEDYQAIGGKLTEELADLPEQFMGFGARKATEWGAGRVGVFEIGAFYRGFIGLDRPPQGMDEWRRLPESSLAGCTNGKVFTDPLGEFTRFRDTLKAFYPEDVRLKKIAARCMNLAQVGQYNYPRCVQREEWVAAQYVEAQFAAQVISVVHLLNRRYMPFYKWMHRSLLGLPLLGESIHKLLSEVATSSDPMAKIRLIEKTGATLIEGFRSEGLSDSQSIYFLDHAPIIHGKIQDERLRNMDIRLG